MTTTMTKIAVPMKLKITLVFLLALAFSAADAQPAVTVIGMAQDGTGAAIAGAEVGFRSGQFTASTITRQDGSFVFASIPATSGTITVRATGFAGLQEHWSSNSSSTPLLFVLQPGGVKEEVIVSASRIEMKLSDVPGSAVLLTGEDLRANPALTLDDLLRQVPGFTLFRRLGASGPSRALVLEDGVPIADPFGGWVYWDRIPRAELASVEVVRGGGSDLYGSNALGGVIQFVTRTPTRTVSSLDLSYGNENTSDLSAWAGTAISRWDFGAGLDMSRTDGYILVPGFQRGTVDTAANSRHATIAASLGYQVGQSGRAFLRGTFFDEARNNGTPLTTNSTGAGFGVAGINAAIGSHDWLSARVFGQAQGYDQTFSSVTTSNRSQEALTNIQHVPSQQMGASGQWNHVLGRQTLIAGIDAQEVIGASDEQLFSASTGNHFANNIAGGRQRSTGIFGEDVFQAGAWTLIAAMRWDGWKNFNGTTVRIPLPSGAAAGAQYPDRDASAFSPRLSILRKLNSNLSVSLAGYRSFRSPTLNELYRSFRLGNTLTQSNPALGPERATGAETGARETAMGGRLEGRETIFWADVVNPITNGTISTTPTLTTRERQNLGRTRSIGAELDGTIRLRGHFQISGGYQYAHATVEDSSPALIGLNVPEVPRQQASVELRYWNPAKLMASVQGRYSGVQFDDDRNTLRLGGFYVMELFAGREIGHGLTAYVAAENLLNRRYVVTLTGAPGSALQSWGPPILARAGLRFEFPSRK